MVVDFIFQYKFLLIPTLAWMIAQFLKVLFELIKNKKIDISRLVGSGGMPSSHSALVVSLATLIGIVEGIDSAFFGIATVFALVVMYDAAGVRRAAGKQAKVLNRLFNHEKGEYCLDEELKEFIGHTPIEVFAGAFLGIVVSILAMVVLT